MKQVPRNANVAKIYSNNTSYKNLPKIVLFLYKNYTFN